MTSNVVIVSTSRGWQFVGVLSDICDTHVELTNAATIRCWGTKNGLGQLRTGPTKETVLDPAGRVRFPMTAIEHIIFDCKGWDNL